MSIFNFFKKKNQDQKETLTEEIIVPPKELFVEEKTITSSSEQKEYKYNLDSIYAFASKDYEEKGYDDALVNPDNSYSEDNIKLLHYDFQVLIKRAYKTYEDYIKDIEFHIESRQNAGLIDTVKLLETTLIKTKDSIEEVKQIEVDFDKYTGLTERIALSYRRGFMRGLAAMSDQILDKHV